MGEQTLKGELTQRPSKVQGLAGQNARICRPEQTEFADWNRHVLPRIAAASGGLPI